MLIVKNLDNRGDFLKRKKSIIISREKNFRCYDDF